jgi:hypothetical protein
MLHLYVNNNKYIVHQTGLAAQAEQLRSELEEARGRSMQLEGQFFFLFIYKFIYTYRVLILSRYLRYTDNMDSHKTPRK